MTADEIKDIVDRYNDLSKKVHDIIKNTYDDRISYVNGIYLSEDGKRLAAGWTYTCRGYSDNELKYIPIEWLQDGFDYRADYEHTLKERNSK